MEKISVNITASKGLRWCIAVVVLVVAAVSWLLPSCGTGSFASEATSVTVPLDSLFGGVFNGEKSPGAVVMVMRGDEIVYSRGFGMARLDKPMPLTDGTMLNVSSASKTYITAGLLKLVEQGKLNLDWALSRFFPNLNEDIFGKITLRHVLTHTSGLPDLRPRTQQQWDNYLRSHPGTPFSLGSDYIHYGHEDEFTRFYEDLDTVVSQPGEQFTYQDPPYMLLPRVIEKVTGEEFEQWMSDNVFAPAGLQDVCYYSKAKSDPRLAHGYKPKSHGTQKGTYVSGDGKWEEFDYGEAPFFLSRSDKGIFTTPREFMKWQKALYSGKVISFESLDSANTKFVDSSWRNIGYGLGAFVQDVDGKPKKIFHNNGNGGFTIIECAFPEHQLFYLVFSNRTDWNRLETSRKADSIFRAHGWLTMN